MTTEDEDALAIEDEVYQRAPIHPRLEDLPEKQFKPWHKPRKHFLRVSQWCSEVAELIKELGLKDGEPLHYLGMPGEDLLDVRTLQGVCERGRVRLRYLGFDSSADNQGQYELNLSKHEVSSLGFTDPFSRILKDRVEHIAVDKSITQMQFQQLAPYDVINLDLCDSVAAGTGLGSYYDALIRICDLQLKAGRARPWLLFIATRAIRSQIDAVSKVKLLQCIQTNMTASATFAERVSKRLRLEPQDVADEIADSKPLEHLRLVPAFGLGLAKWLLKVCMSTNPKVVVRLLSSYCYRIEMSEPDMLSLAFRFEPIIEPRLDESGLGRPVDVSGLTPIPTEEALGVALAESIGDVKDVDKLLADDAKLMEKVTSQAAKILEAARYPRDKYLAWVASTPTFGNSSRDDKGVVAPSE